MNYVPYAVLMVLCFVVGSVPFGFLLARKLKGVDLRKVGSCNVGATNASRILGKPLGILVLILDVLKGSFAAGLVPYLFIRLFPVCHAAIVPYLTPQGIPISMGIMAFLGHCFSPFLRFKGGKGVATALGVYLVLVPMAALVTFIVCALIIIATRFVSLASITGAILLPVLITVFDFKTRPFPWVILVVTVLLSSMVIFRHRANIKRLIAGKENKV